jgi:hypothetical protein
MESLNGVGALSGEGRRLKGREDEERMGREVVAILVYK